MKTLIIKNNVVENIVSGEVDYVASEGSTHFEVDDDYRANIGWLWDGENVIEPPPPTPEQPEPSPSWVGFNAAFLGNANWQTIASLFSTPDIRIGVAAAAGTANIQALIAAYNFAIADLTAQNIPLNPAVLAEWQNIADANDIPINFEV
jgi:hypothetical protein